MLATALADVLVDNDDGSEGLTLIDIELAAIEEANGLDLDGLGDGDTDWLTLGTPGLADGLGDDKDDGRDGPTLTDGDADAMDDATGLDEDRIADGDTDTDADGLRLDEGLGATDELGEGERLAATDEMAEDTLELGDTDSEDGGAGDPD